jgi:hypothetical protein
MIYISVMVQISVFSFIKSMLLLFKSILVNEITNFDHHWGVHF